MSKDDKSLVDSVLKTRQAEMHHHRTDHVPRNAARVMVSPWAIGACIVLMMLVSHVFAVMGLGMR